MKNTTQSEQNLYVEFVDQDPHIYGQSDLDSNKTLTLEVAKQHDSALGHGGYTNVKLMGLTYALASVDQLIAQCLNYDDIFIEFTGSEPLLNRQLIRQVTEYTSKQARQKNLWVNYCVVTNANFLTSSDAQFFAKYKFTVNVNIDGPKTVNDKKNTTTEDKNQYYNALRGVGFLRSHKPAKLNAHVKVTPVTPGLLPLMQHMFSLGFEKVEFIPELSISKNRQQYTNKQLDHFMIEIAECSSYAKTHLARGRKFSFRDFDALPQKKAALVNCK